VTGQSFGFPGRQHGSKLLITSSGLVSDPFFPFSLSLFFIKNNKSRIDEALVILLVQRSEQGFCGGLFAVV
jgi:hypothetical protein